MRLKDIIKIADKAYGDGLILEYFRTRRPIGDTLAEFIVHELEETYDKEGGTKRQRSEACRVMENATEQLNAVYDALARETGHGRH